MLLNKPDQELVMGEITISQLHRYDADQRMIGMQAQLHKDSGVKYAGNINLTFSDSALRQLLNMMSVPVLFYNRCSNALKIAIFNEFKAKFNTDKRIKLRMDPGKPPSQFTICEPRRVRAVLSTGYTACDDHQLFPIVFKALEDEGITYRAFRRDDHVTQLIVNFPDASVDYNGQTYTAGMTVSNSETGHSSVWIEPVVHSNSCTFVNRRVLTGQGVDCRIVHRGNINDERINTMVKSCKEVAQVGVVQLIEAWQEIVSASYALTYAKAIDSLPKRLHDILKEEWEEEQELVKAEVARRIILLAQELPLFQRVTVEQEAGKILGLFSNYKARMEQIAQELE